MSSLAEGVGGAEGGLYVAPTLGLTSVGAGAGLADNTDTGRLPAVCMPVAWKEAARSSDDQRSVDVCMHLNPVGWRELVEFFRVTTGDGERAIELAEREWSAASSLCSLDATSFELKNCPAAGEGPEHRGVLSLG